MSNNHILTPKILRVIFSLLIVGMNFSNVFSQWASEVNISQAWWAAPVDQDCDGYSQQAELKFIVNFIPPGEYYLYSYTIKYRGTWNFWNVLPGCENVPLNDVYNSITVKELVFGLDHDRYDFRIIIKNPTGEVCIYDNDDDSDLNDRYFEQRDEDPLRFEVFNVAWHENVDNDGDGYTQSRKLYFSTSVLCGSHLVRAYLYVKREYETEYTFYAATNTFELSGDYCPISNITVGLPNDELPHGSYDFLIRIKDIETDTFIRNYFSNSDPVIDNQKFEKSTEDIIPTLSATPSNVPVASTSGSTGSINVVSNTSWTVSDNASWLSLSAASGTGNGTLTVTTTSANTSTSPRSANVIFSASGVSSITVVVTQQGAGPTLSATPSNVPVASTSGSTGSINVVSNTSWTVSDNASWLSLSAASGTGNGTLTVTTTSANTSTSPRSANVIFSGSGVNSITIIVTQTGTSNSPPHKPQLLTPGSGTSWTTPFDISWECTDPDPGDVLTYTLVVRLKGLSTWDSLSMGSQTSYPVTDWGESDLGTYEWSVEASDGEVQSVSDIWEFTLARSTITVISPNGGETWQVGSNQEITWTSSGTSGNVRIELSTNNGSSWSDIVPTTPDDGSYTWTVANTPSTSCLVRITDVDGSPTDQSNAVFTISEVNNPPNAPRLLTPDNGTSWTTPFDISWECTDPDPGDVLTYTLMVRIKGLSSWDLLSMGSQTYYPVTDWDDSDLGTHEWRVEASDGEFQSISDIWEFTLVNTTITVTSPNGGETWFVNSNQNITWTSNETSGNVRIEYSTNNGSSWTNIIASTADDGTHPWTIPDTPSTSCLVRISDTDGSPTDQSNTVFTISEVNNPPNVPSLLSPDDGTTWTTPFDISWECTDPDPGDVLTYTLRVRLKGLSSWDLLSMGSQTSFPVTGWSVSELGTYEWSVIASDGELQSVSEIREFTLANSSLTVISPNGGETWEVGSNQNITWTSNETSGNVRIEFSNNNGSSWTDIIASTVDDGTHPWTIPNTPSTNCLVRISDIDGSLMDQSNTVFTIAAVAVTGISVLPTTLDLFAGGATGTIVATVVPSNATNKNITWNSSDDGLATVNSTGVVTPIALGTVNITATTIDGEFTAICVVTVTDQPVAVTGISVQPTTMNLNAGGATGTIIASVVPSNATNQNVLWSSSAPDVAAVSSTGVVTPLAAGGVIITATTVDGGFTANCVVNVVAVINLTSPNGGEAWRVGSNQSISWTSNGTSGNVRIEYSTNNGTSWTDIIASTQDDGSHQWTMPDTPSTNCLVRISDTDGSPTDQSDAVFAITEITFISDLAVSDFQFLPQTISVGATPDLVSYRLTNLGPADLTPPNTYVNESIVLSENTTIGDGDDIDIFLYSNDYFLSSGNYTDNIPSYLYQYMIIPHVPTGDYYIFFEVQHSSPSSALIDPNLSNNYAIRSGTIHIINESQIPSIDITSPNGGETWQVGSTQNISWTSNETSGNVRIEYSIDSGSSWTDVINNTPDDGSYYWTVQNNPSTTCLVRISDTDGSPTDQSNEVFTIAAVAVTGVSVQPATMNLYAGGLTGTVVATIVPANATNKNVTWSSSNIAVATVSSTGVVTPLSVGTANITATTDDGGFTANCEVTVETPPCIVPEAPVIVSITQPSCSVATGSVVLTNLPPSGSWTLTVNLNGAIINGTGTDYTVTGLTSGTHSFTVTNESACTSLPSENVVIIPNPSTPAAPSIGLITQPTCNIPNGSVTLNGLPTTGNWTLTQNPDGIIRSGTGVSITVTNLLPGIYSYTITNSSGCISEKSEDMIIDLPDNGVVPKITIKYNDILICYNVGDSIVSYQWYIGSDAISDATKQYYQTNQEPGIYKVVTVDINGCINPSNAITLAGSKSVSVYPNPASHSIVLKLNNFSEEDALIRILNTAGIGVLEFEAKNLNEGFHMEIPISKLKEGIYIVQVLLKSNEVYYTKVVVVK